MDDQVTSSPSVPAGAARWLLTALCTLLSWALATFLGGIAYLAGSQFMSGPSPDRAAFVGYWVLAGAFVALPLTALPTLGFGIGRRTVWAAAGLVVVAVTLVGVFVLNAP